MTPLRTHALKPVAVLALASVLIGVLLIPSARDLATSVIGLGGDPYQTLWRMDALQRALSRGSLTVPEDPIRNFGPLPWAPLTAALPDVLAYNVIWLLQAPLAALATFALGRRLGLPPWPAAVAGFLVAFAPYRLAQGLGHFGAMQLFWIPLTLVAVLAWVTRPTLSRTFAVAAALVGTSWAEHTLFLTTLLGVLATGLVFAHDLRARLASRRGVILVFAALGMVVIAGLFPFARELQEVSRPTSPLNPGHAQRLRFAPTWASLFTLPPFHRAKASGAPYGTPRDTVADHVHSLNMFASALAVVAALMWWRTDRRSVALLLALIVLGIGLAVAPRIPGGERLYQLPILSALRAVDRFEALAVVAIPLLAARSLAFLPRTAAVGFSLVLLLEILPVHAVPMQSASIPSYVERLADAPAGAVLEVPAAADYLVASRALYVSSAHRRPVLGHRAFERVRDPASDVTLLQLPVVRDLLLLRVSDLEQRTFFNQEPREIARAALASEQVVAIVVPADILGIPVVRQSAEGVVPAAQDDLGRIHAFLRSVGFTADQGDGARVYPVPPWSAEDSAFVALRGEGWERISRDDGTVIAALRDGAAVEVRVLGERPLPLTLTFRTRPGTSARVLRLDTPAGPGVPVEAGAVSRLPLGTLAPGRYLFTLRLEPASGRTIDATEIIVENPSITTLPGSA